MVISDFSIIDRDVANANEKEIMAQFEDLEKETLEAHQKIMAFKVASGYSSEVAVDNLEIDRYSKAHILRLKRILSSIRKRIINAEMYGDTRVRLNDMANDLEFKIDTVGLSVM